MEDCCQFAANYSQISSKVSSIQETPPLQVFVYVHEELAPGVESLTAFGAFLAAGYPAPI